MPIFLVLSSQGKREESSLNFKEIKSEISDEVLSASGKVFKEYTLRKN